MKYQVINDDLFGHTVSLGEFDTLEEARDYFKSECYCPATTYDDFLCLEEYTDDGEWHDTLDDYPWTRLDRPDE